MPAPTFAPQPAQFASFVNLMFCSSVFCPPEKDPGLAGDCLGIDSAMMHILMGLQNTIDGIYYTSWLEGMQAVLCGSTRDTEKLSCTYGQTSADVLF